MQILLIDDEVRKAQALVDYFREVCGWSVDIANSPARALQLLGAERVRAYDLIILDIMMDPGDIISRELSEGGRSTGLILLDSIVKLTAGEVLIALYTARTDLEHLKSDGRAAAYLQKPRTAREISREIVDLFANRRSR